MISATMDYINLFHRDKKCPIETMLTIQESIV